MNVGIFGGAFNPPHIGHVKAAQTAARQNKLDLLLVIPTGTPPHKHLPNGSPCPEMRLKMTRNAFELSDRTTVSDMEVYCSANNYTIDTVNKIKQEYNSAHLFLLVGTDMYESLETWKDSEALLGLVTPVLLTRTVINISSSEIREMLPMRKGREYLAESNYAYIIKHRLYDAKPDWDWLRERSHSMLLPLRVPHVDACEVAALQLADYWNVDKDDAREAAILHDITKKLDFSENMCIIAEHGIYAESIGKREEKLLHSITGALIAQTDFGVSDAVANAIKWHTTGKAQMTTLEKVIYLADYIEATREFPGIEQLRKLSFESIDDAMIMGLEMTIDDLKSRGIEPCAASYEALEDLKKNNGNYCKG
ncbi:MAG: bis(5'-nucleosyl)-tetraphosphatase (symmetrical) YqeK [Oscillospiraceae bacterium]|nr:bis(5'-nucleosyl)-tetraphosphatase (symmetrical) YqeK [Oscillospiraceae bacterium]